MKRLLLVVLLAAASAVAQQPAAAPAVAPPPPSAAPPSALPCRPADSTINAVLWMQTSAEYQALVRQAYAAAARTLDAALADPTWTAAIEQPGPAASLPPAIVLDLDETMLDTSAHQQGLIVSGRAYTEPGWHEYAMTDASRPLEAAVDFVRYAKKRGVDVYYVTNRLQSEEEPLRQTLARNGFPLDPSVDTVLTRGEQDPRGSSDKGPRREFIARTHRIIMLFGDDLNDFIPANTLTLAERDHLMRQYGENWGRKWFILPNPVYGSWERQMLGDTKGVDDCAQLQRKIRTIRGR